MGKVKILWCGPFFSDVALREKRAVNQAAAKWSRGLLRGLEQAGAEIRVVDHCTEQRWPKGRVFWQDNDSKWFLDWYPCERIAYCNVWGVKERWLDWMYALTARRIFSSWKPDVILCYNSLHSFNVAVMREAAKCGICSVPIILDGDDPRKDNWGKLLHDNRFASGIVFLSWWMYQNYPHRDVPLLHMDGGAAVFKGKPPAPNSNPPAVNRSFTLVHTGSLDKWRGLNFMKDVVRIFKRQDVRFIFCGKCDKETMSAEFGNDPRVVVLGFVSGDVVDELCSNADVFLNVREPSVGDNILNYPSKIPNYLAWGRPVVTTWIDSFSPEYRDILEVCDNTPEDFVSVLNQVIEWNDARRQEKYMKIKSWFETRKNWSRQASRLIRFLGEDIL